MSYRKNGLVQAQDYNTYVGVDPSSSSAGFNTVYATGYGRSGYGQSHIPRVLLNGTVTATEWASLVNKMTVIANHQGTTIDSMTPPATNGLITAVSSTTLPVLSLLEFNLAKLYANRNHAVAQGTEEFNQITSTSTFSESLLFTHTITFESGDKARYFFNAGGQIELIFSHPDGTGMNDLWNNLATACGRLTLSAHSSGTVTIAGNPYTGLTRTNGSGSPNILLTNFGFYSLSSSRKTIFKQFATVGPSNTSLSSYIEVTAMTNGSRQSNGDVGDTLYITTRFVQVPPGGTYQVSGVGSSATCFVKFPSTSYLQNTWGSVNVISDYISNSAEGSVPPPEPPIVPPVIITPSTYQLNWTESNPNFGTQDTLVVTLDVAATVDMTLAIPYSSTIAGISDGILSAFIPKGQLTGRTTLNLSSAADNSNRAPTLPITVFDITSSKILKSANVIVNRYPNLIKMSPPPTVDADVLIFGSEVTPSGPQTRTASTIAKVDLSLNTTLSFYVNKGTTTDWGQNPTVGEELTLEYSTDSSTWVQLIKIPTTVLENTWLLQSILIPNGAKIPSGVFLRFKQVSGGGSARRDTWATTSIVTNQPILTGGTVTTNSGTLSIAPISLSLIGGSQAFTMSPASQRTFIYTADASITVPTGITNVNITLVGGGGGAGALDYGGLGAGNNGTPGKKLTGDLKVSPGDTLEFYIGSGGQGGTASRNNKKQHTYGGTNSYSWNGGEAGLLIVSGQGGGGGAGTGVLLNGAVVAVAAGGGGGGGSGTDSAGKVRTKIEYTTGSNGEKGADVEDAGSGGGGGGGELGGKGGEAGIGDTGAYQGSQGKSKVPTEWSESTLTNWGFPYAVSPYPNGAVVENLISGKMQPNGGNGYVIITY